MYIKSETNTKQSLTFWDILFIVGILLAPMTALRLFKFGPGEILLIIWMISVYSGNNPSKEYSSYTLPISNIGRYQITNLGMMVIGFLVNTIIYSAEKNMNQVLTDYISHIFMFLFSACMILYFKDRDVESIHCIIDRIVTIGAVAYAALLIYATYVSPTLFGLPLWLGYRYRFQGLALNPHQIGMITGAGVCFSLYLMSVSESRLKKIQYIVVCGIWYWVSLSIRSDTLTLTYIILVALTFIIKIPKGTPDPQVRRSNFIVIIICVGIAIIFAAPYLLDKLASFVTEAGNGLGRLELWNSGLGQFREKTLCFFTGLGPGGNAGMYLTQHVTASSFEAEAHNTYVQQILNSGIFVCIYYISIVIKIIERPIEKNTYLIMGVLYFVLYGFGGNMNKRVLVWFTYIIVMILTEKTRDTEIANK